MEKNKSMHLQFAKMFFFLIYFYSLYFQYVYFATNLAMILLGSGMALFVFIHLIRYRNTTLIADGFPPEAIIWLFFVLSATISSFKAVVIGGALSPIIALLEVIILCILVLFITAYEKKYDFLLISIAFVAAICAFGTIAGGEEFKSTGRLSLVSGYNPNLLGNMLLTGIFSLIILCVGRKKLVKFICIALITAMSYAIILTASRKSFIALCLLLAYWFFVCFLPQLNKKSITNIITLVFVSIMVASLFYLIVLPWLSNSMVMQRMDILVSSGNDIRKELYREAIELFKMNPILGIGYHQFRFYNVHGYYSHSTHAEALCCTGIIGTLIYFSSWVLIIANSFRAIYAAKYVGDKTNLFKAKMGLGMMITIMFVAVGIIHFYGICGFIILSLIVSLNRCVLNQCKVVT